MRGKILPAIVCLAVGAVGALLVVWGTLPVSQAECRQGGCPPANPNCPGACGNGDVNGSGDIDVADAIYVLGYLFAKGPPSVAIECPPSQLPATGQTLCYNKTAKLDACPQPGQDFYGQDCCYQKGCSMNNRFMDNGDGTVTDNCTGLMWQKETASTDNDPVVDGRDVVDWQFALKFCEDLILCNDGTWMTDLAQASNHQGVKYDDWRLPNQRELTSLIHYGRNAPAIDMTFRSETLWYWTSTTKNAAATAAWGVHFDSGDTSWFNKSTGYYVRAVRDTQ